MTKYTALILFTVMISCAARQTPIPEPQSKEAVVYAQRCGECHSIPHPKRHTYGQWEHMLEVMDKQMEHKGMGPLIVDEKVAIKRYLKNHSR